jgi:hypothetical protein
MADQPEALRLADVLDHVELRPSDYKDVDKAAAELRRLHELNVDKTEIIAALSAVNQELLEALKYHQEQTRPIERTRAAIAKAEG